VAEQQLNLLEVASGGAAKLGTGAAGVVGLEGDADLTAIAGDELQHGLG